MADEEINEPETAQRSPVFRPGVAQKLDLGKILTDAAMRHPKEVNNFLDEYVGSEGKSLILSTLSQTNPTYGAVIEKLFPVKGNGNGNSSKGRNEIEEENNPLDDNDEEKDYSIPDTEILDEVRNFACSLHMGGYGWSAISDQIYSKYDIDWNPLKIKNIVLKNLAWDHRTLQPAPVMPMEVPQKSQDEKKGLIRRFMGWLY